jgi:flavin-dependent trigonelline monooxygenase, reductase component
MTPAAIDTRALRDAFGCFMTGVTVVTTLDADGRPLGFTANSFSSVSLDPPLLLVSIANSSANLDAFARGRGFAVNILSESQKDVSATFARRIEDRFASVYWKRGPVGSPLIADVSAWFDCSLEKSVPAGDHTILIGRIGAFEASSRPGLGYHRGAYVTPAATAVGLPAGPNVVLSAVLEAEGQVLLVDDGRGGLSVPMARVGREGVQAALDALIASVGVTAEAGSIYAVYEDVRLGTQHIALRCPATLGKPRRGAFVELSRTGVSDVTDPALRQMLDRLADESRMGNYGIYFGTHEQGRVQRIEGDIEGGKGQ